MPHTQVLPPSLPRPIIAHLVTPMMQTSRYCNWRSECFSTASGFASHPSRGLVPICDRCNRFFK